jgi:hypothetical protein
MPCFSPLTAWRPKVNSGCNKLVFNPKYAEQQDDPMQISCGQCKGCRLERSRQWAVRCLHEAQMHDCNSFITLTFSEESIVNRDVDRDDLDVREFQLFMKRLRKHYEPAKVRFFHCGEYGDMSGRPHYHAIIFGIDFMEDRVLYKESPTGERYYISETLSKLWPYGWAIIGNVSFESAAYVARYIMKKVNGKDADEHYKRLVVDDVTGEVVGERYLKPEYTTMSRRPGIGKDWFDKFKTDVYPSDFITVNGKKVTPPKYYDKLLELEDPFLLQDLKAKRAETAMAHAEDNTPERLMARAAVFGRRIEKLVRTI